ncbi:RHS repeat-associated core domain-containing protein [Erwinia tasmaniensis]|uniref:Nematicidal protein 2 n=1 Tax=Erwinia tasmaniensis (strain DSM 17950 / CFBP 7177 / CIP 109463 / NCPPB 4357 / Et1/99) TaxID=465817 RepID=B2VBS8_ERWT9|nr:RHS repeat-associated core domain-containing protein [Erwinia tasmaniensis]CAO97329.1 Nematicidal protein 2 [Erwinia tasmaniensis Et1/99]
MEDITKKNENININIQQDNFISACMSGVDPRNGVFNHATTIFDYSSVISEAKFSFVLNYNSKAIYADQGYGYGFTDNLSRYDEKKKILTLSSGQVYSILNDSEDKQPVLIDYNFESFTFTKVRINSLPNIRCIYYIKHMDGVVEKLENRDLQGITQDCFVPTVIYHGIISEIIMRWDYSDGIPYLQAVMEKNSDVGKNKYLLVFTKIDESERKIRVFEDESYGYDVLLRKNKKNLLFLIRNYGFDNSGKYCWDFKYSNKQGKGRLLIEIDYPCGRKDRVEYIRARDKFNSHLVGDLKLYKVRRYFITPYPDSAAKKIVTQYTFNLSQNDMRYSSIEEYMDLKFRVIKIIHRNYNKFHLLVAETTEMGLAITEVVYTYENCDEGKALSQQPCNYQCITEINKISTDKAIVKNNQRHEVANMSYDERGNLTRQIDNDITIFFTYIYKVNNSGKVVDIPNGMSLMKSIEIMYLKSPGNNIIKEYEYELFLSPDSPLGKNEKISTYKLVPVREETRINNILIKSTSFEYFKLISRKAQIGKLKSLSIQLFDKLIVKNLNWSGEYYNSELILYIKTEVKGLVINEVIVWDVVTGLLKSSIDSLNRKCEYKKDKVGRVLSEKIISNIHDKVKSKVFEYKYEYKIDNAIGGFVYEKKTTDLHNRSIYERYDGLGRLQSVAMSKIEGEREKILHAYKYDDLSRLDYEEHFSYGKDERFSYISIYSYDDWGYIKSIKHNDGVEENIVTDVINRTKAHWLAYGNEIINETLITFDKNNEPISYRRFFLNGEYLQVTIERDFCGRMVKYHDEIGNITQYEYDLFDRINKIHFPDDSEIIKEYNKYSDDHLIEKLVFRSSDGNELDIGTQSFDELNRLIESKSYGVITKYTYSLHYPLPDMTFFTDGTSHIYKNDYGLQDNVLSVIDNKNKFSKTFKYSELDGSLIESKFVTPRDIYIEKINENVKENSVTIKTKFIHDGRVIDLLYRQIDNYNNEGIYKIIDETNAEYLYLRDGFGRIKEMRSGETITEISYDIFSRISQISECDADSKSVIEYVYDEFSREKTRRVSLFFERGNGEKFINNPDVIFSIYSNYYNNNLIKSRIIEQYKKDKKIEVRKEYFNYDIMNRISFYECNGTSAIKGEGKKAIKSIGYSYDEVGNISYTDTAHTDGSKVRLSFHYKENNPFLLSWVQNESTLDITQNEFNSLGFLINKTYTKRVNADFSTKLNVDFYYNIFFNLSSVRNTTSGTNTRPESQNIVYRYGASEKIFFRKSVADKAKKEEVFTHRGYGDEIVNLIDFKDQSKYKKIYSLYGAAKKIVQKTDDHSINSTILTNDSGSPIYTIRYWNGKYVSSTYSSVGVYGSTEEKEMQPGLNGCLYDGENGSYLLGPRLYDPYTMRFTTPDSLSPFDGGNINPYIFCNNNPVNSNDSTGYITWESWRRIVYTGAVMSIATGIITLGFSIAMSSVLMSAVSIMQIVGGAMTIFDIKNHDNSGLVVHGIYTVLDMGLSLFSMHKIFKLPLSKNLNRIFDLNRSLKKIRTLPVNKNRKKLSGINYLGRGVSVFTDSYKQKPRLNIYSHGKKTALIETRIDKSGKIREVGRMSSKSLDDLLNNSGGIKYDDYASIRLIACHSGDSRYFKSALGYDMHQITGLPVKAFHGKVTIFGIPPETLQSYFERFSSDPHSLHNIRKMFSSDFKIVHDSNYSPRYFS